MKSDIFIEIDGHEVLVHQGNVSHVCAAIETLQTLNRELDRLFDNYNHKGEEITAQPVKGFNLDYVVREPRKI